MKVFIFIKKYILIVEGLENTGEQKYKQISSTNNQLNASRPSMCLFRNIKLFGFL